MRSQSGPVVARARGARACEALGARAPCDLAPANFYGSLTLQVSFYGHGALSKLRAPVVFPVWAFARARRSVGASRRGSLNP
eukprot:4344055-Pleurochrysis_carterae.AAC.1